MQRHFLAFDVSESQHMQEMKVLLIPKYKRIEKNNFFMNAFQRFTDPKIFPCFGSGFLIGTILQC